MRKHVSSFLRKLIIEGASTYNILDKLKNVMNLIEMENSGRSRSL